MLSVYGCCRYEYRPAGDQCQPECFYLVNSIWRRIHVLGGKQKLNSRVCWFLSLSVSSFLFYFFFFLSRWWDHLGGKKSTVLFHCMGFSYKVLCWIVHFCNLPQRLFSSDANVALNQSKMQQESKQRERASVKETPPPRVFHKQLLWVQAPSLEDCVNVKIVQTMRVPDSIRSSSLSLKHGPLDME